MESFQKYLMLFWVHLRRRVSNTELANIKRLIPVEKKQR